MQVGVEGPGEEGLCGPENSANPVSCDGSAWLCLSPNWSPDGCDIAGRNVFVQNLTITNFDDTVCIKPLSGNDVLSQCAYVTTRKSVKRREPSAPRVSQL